MPTDLAADTGSYVGDGYALFTQNWEQVERLGGYRKVHVKDAVPPVWGQIKIYRKGIPTPIEISVPSSSNVIIRTIEGGYEIEIQPNPS
jgi:hypothetical protein